MKRLRYAYFDATTILSKVIIHVILLEFGDGEEVFQVLNPPLPREDTAQDAMDPAGSLAAR